MEPTQRMDDGPLDNESESDEKEFKQEVFGYLKFEDRIENDENSFSICGGITNIGRDPGQCEITINEKVVKVFALFQQSFLQVFFQCLSRLHAVLEVCRDGAITIHDNNSLNHTWKNGNQLKPQVRYALEGDEKLAFGDIKAKFTLHQDVKNTSSASTVILDKDNESIFDDQREMVFVPETPVASGQGRVSDFPTPFRSRTDKSTPARIGAMALKVPESPACLESSAVGNESSFIAPSQCLAGGFKKVGADTLQLLDMETQPQASGPVTVTQVVNKIMASDPLFQQETQQIQGSMFDKETQAFPKDSLLEAETQAFGASRKSNILDDETQAFAVPQASRKKPTLPSKDLHEQETQAMNPQGHGVLTEETQPFCDPKSNLDLLTDDTQPIVASKTERGLFSRETQAIGASALGTRDVLQEETQALHVNEDDQDLFFRRNSSYRCT